MVERLCFLGVEPFSSPNVPRLQVPWANPSLGYPPLHHNSKACWHATTVPYLGRCSCKSSNRTGFFIF